MKPGTPGVVECFVSAVERFEKEGDKRGGCRKWWACVSLCACVCMRVCVCVCGG